MSQASRETPPILSGKRHGEPSTFTPENLLREARRQRPSTRPAFQLRACSIRMETLSAASRLAEGRHSTRLGRATPRSSTGCRRRVSSLG